MIDRLALKNLAKEQIKGNIGVLFVMLLIVYGVSFVVGFIPVAGGLIGGWVLGPAFGLSLAMVYLGLAKGIKPNISQIFDGFYDLWCAIKVTFFVGLFTMLWSLLFIIPGIIKAYSYSMAIFILAENKGMPALEAIRRSKEMMEGHKMDLFVLELSFIGWGLLTALTFGIVGIWAIPYITATTTNFYNTIKGEPTPVVVTEATEVAATEATEETATEAE